MVCFLFGHLSLMFSDPGNGSAVAVKYNWDEILPKFKSRLSKSFGIRWKPVFLLPNALLLKSRKLTVPWRRAFVLPVWSFRGWFEYKIGQQVEFSNLVETATILKYSLKYPTQGVAVVVIWKYEFLVVFMIFFSYFLTWGTKLELNLTLMTDI